MSSKSETETSSFMSSMGIAFLTFNTLMAAFRSRKDPAVLVFVVSAYTSIMLLFWCLHHFERLPEKSEKRERLKIPIWLLATAVNFAFAFQVSAVLPLAMGWFIWVMAGLSSFTTFYFFFIYGEAGKTSSKSKNDGKEYSPVEEV